MIYYVKSVRLKIFIREVSVVVFVVVFVVVVVVVSSLRQFRKLFSVVLADLSSPRLARSMTAPR
jgi:hypothetical protein